MRRLLSFVLLLATGSAAICDYEPTEPEAPEKVAMQFVTSAFFERDAEQAVRFIHDDAERKSYGKGSVIRDLRDEIPSLPPMNELVLQEIHFAHSRELERIARRLTVFVAERDSVSQEDASVNVELLRKELRVDDESFVTCLIWRNVPSRKKTTQAHMLFVFKIIDGKYKITVMRDD